MFSSCRFCTSALAPRIIPCMLETAEIRYQHEPRNECAGPRQCEGNDEWPFARVYLEIKRMYLDWKTSTNDTSTPPGTLKSAPCRTMTTTSRGRRLGVMGK